MITTLAMSQIMSVSVASFSDAVNRNDKHGAAKWFHLLIAEIETACDQGAALRELLRAKPPLCAYLTLALQGAESIPTITADDLRKLRSFCGIWRN